MNGYDLVAEILRKEGVDWMACFPANPLIEVIAKHSIRPVIFRSERAGIHAADGYSRLMDGEKFGVFCMQRGPGSENAFGGVAQAFGDGIPVLILADSDVTTNQDMTVSFRTPKNFRHISKWADTVRSPERISAMFRRAFNEMRTGRPGPVVLELPRDVMAADVPEAAQNYVAARAGKFLPPQSDITSAVDALLNAKRPLIWSGQGTLMGAASESLTELAEIAGIPVMTTMPGKSGFNETHPLSLGATNLTYSGQARKWLHESDVVFAVGTSMSGTHYGQRPPDGKTLIHCSADPSDINRDYDIDIPLPGDAKLVLDAMIEIAKGKVSEPGHGRRVETEREIKESRDPWMESWQPILTSDEVPINPYRVIWEMDQMIDHDTSVVTHDAGHPRDQMMPFYTATVPHSYIGWGKTTHLGYGLGLMIGAKMAKPERFCVSFMGDAAFGHCGMDVETAVRNNIPITIVVINNSGMGGYKEGMPTAYEQYGASVLSGNYAALAESLGAKGIRVEQPDGIGAALQQARSENESGNTVLVEIITSMENRMSKP